VTRPRSRLLLPILSLATLAFALCVHEAGHAVATWISGGHVIEFVLFSGVPHVVSTRAASHAIEAFRIASGSALTVSLIISILGLWGWRRSIITETLGLFALIEITGWIASALQLGDSQNDATDFMACTGISGFILGIICVCVALLGVIIIARSSRRRYRCALVPPRDTAAPSSSPATVQVLGRVA